MNDKSKQILTTYVSDMQAVERSIYEAVDRQVSDSHTQAFPQASALVQRLRDQAESHARGLQDNLQSLGGVASSPAATVKGTVTMLAGMAAGMIDRVRTYPVSKMLRDDYTVLSHAAIGYTMLHTTALALQHPPTAELAVRHLQNITPIIIEISEMIPSLVVDELAANALVVDTTVVEQARQNTHRTWTRESLDRAA
jgi:hypothetical protein